MPNLAEAWANALKLFGRTTRAEAAFAKAKELGRPRESSHCQ